MASRIGGIKREEGSGSHSPSENSPGYSPIDRGFNVPKARSKPASVLERLKKALKAPLEPEARKALLEQLDHHIKDLKTLPEKETQLKDAQNLLEEQTKILNQSKPAAPVSMPPPETVVVREPIKLLNLVSLPDWMTGRKKPLRIVPAEELETRRLDELLASLQRVETCTQEWVGTLSEEQNQQALVFGDESGVRRALYQRQQRESLKVEHEKLEARKVVLASTERTLREEKIALIAAIQAPHLNDLTTETLRQRIGKNNADEDKIRTLQTIITNQKEQVSQVENLLERMEQVTLIQSANKKILELSKELNPRKKKLKALKDLLDLQTESKQQERLVELSKDQSLQIPLNLNDSKVLQKRLLSETQVLEQQIQNIDALANHHLSLIRQFDLEQRSLPRDSFSLQVARQLFRDLAPSDENAFYKIMDETWSGFKESLPERLRAVTAKLTQRFPKLGQDRINNILKNITQAPGREHLTDLVRDHIMSQQGVTLADCKKSFTDAAGEVKDFFSGQSKTKFDTKNAMVELLSWFYHNPQAAQDLSSDIQSVLVAFNALGEDNPLDRLLASLQGKAQTSLLGLSEAYAEDAQLTPTVLGFLEYARAMPYMVSALSAPGSTVLGRLPPASPGSILARVGDFAQNAITIAASKVVSSKVSNTNLPIANLIQDLRDGVDFKDAILGVATKQKIAGLRRIYESYKAHGFWKTAKSVLTFQDTRRVWKYAGRAEKIARFASAAASAVGAVGVLAGLAMTATVALAPVGAVVFAVGAALSVGGYSASALLDGTFTSSRAAADREETRERNQKNILTPQQYRYYLQQAIFDPGKDMQSQKAYQVNRAAFQTTSKPTKGATGSKIAEGPGGKDYQFKKSVTAATLVRQAKANFSERENIGEFIAATVSQAILPSGVPHVSLVVDSEKHQLHIASQWISKSPKTLGDKSTRVNPNDFRIKQSLADAIALSALHGDHDINPENMLLDDNGHVVRIDFGHAFNDLLRFPIGAAPVSKNPIVDFFNRETINGIGDGAKSKLWRHYEEGLIPSQEMIDALKRVAAEDPLPGMHLAQEQLLAIQDVQIQKDVKKALESINQSAGNPPIVLEASYDKVLESFFNNMKEFYRKRAAAMRAAAETMQIQFDLDRIIRQGNQKQIDMLTGQVEWFKTKAKEKPFVGTIAEYIKHYGSLAGH